MGVRGINFAVGEFPGNQERRCLIPLSGFPTGLSETDYLPAVEGALVDFEPGEAGGEAGTR